MSNVGGNSSGRDTSAWTAGHEDEAFASARTTRDARDEPLTGIALAAGLGTRLRPLTDTRPKASLPLGSKETLLDVALGRIEPFVTTAAVTISASSASLVPLLPAEVQVVDEGPRPLGTTLGVMEAQRLLGGDILMTTTDTWYSETITEFVSSWDRERIRLLMTLDLFRNDYSGTWRFTGTALIPSRVLTDVQVRTGDIVADLFDPHFEKGSLDIWLGQGQFIDCGTPHDLWAANMIASRGLSVIEDGVHVDTEVYESVILAGSDVDTTEPIVQSIIGPGFRWRLPDVSV